MFYKNIEELENEYSRIKNDGVRQDILDVHKLKEISKELKIFYLCIDNIFNIKTPEFRYYALNEIIYRHVKGNKKLISQNYFEKFYEIFFIQVFQHIDFIIPNILECVFRIQAHIFILMYPIEWPDFIMELTQHADDEHLYPFLNKVILENISFPPEVLDFMNKNNDIIRITNRIISDIQMLKPEAIHIMENIQNWLPIQKDSNLIHNIYLSIVESNERYEKYGVSNYLNSISKINSPDLRTLIYTHPNFIKDLDEIVSMDEPTYYYSIKLVFYYIHFDVDFYSQLVPNYLPITLKLLSKPGDYFKDVKKFVENSIFLGLVDPEIYLPIFAEIIDKKFSVIVDLNGCYFGEIFVLVIKLLDKTKGKNCSLMEFLIKYFRFDESNQVLNLIEAVSYISIHYVNDLTRINFLIYLDLLCQILQPQLINEKCIFEQHCNILIDTCEKFLQYSIELEEEVFQKTLEFLFLSISSYHVSYSYQLLELVINCSKSKKANLSILTDNISMLIEMNNQFLLCSITSLINMLPDEKRVVEFEHELTAILQNIENYEEDLMAYQLEKLSEFNMGNIPELPYDFHEMFIVPLMVSIEENRFSAKLYDKLILFDLSIYKHNCFKDIWNLIMCINSRRCKIAFIEASISYLDTIDQPDETLIELVEIIDSFAFSKNRSKNKRFVGNLIDTVQQAQLNFLLESIKLFTPLEYPEKNEYMKNLIIVYYKDCFFDSKVQRKLFDFIVGLTEVDDYPNLFNSSNSLYFISKEEKNTNITETLKEFYHFIYYMQTRNRSTLFHPMNLELLRERLGMRKDLISSSFSSEVMFLKFCNDLKNED